MAGPDAGSSGSGLHVRREPFEFGLLPLSSLYHKFVDGVPAFIKLKARLQQQPGASASGPRVQAAAIAESLSISPTHAQLLLDTLACVLPEDGPDADPLATTTAGEVESVGADVDILVLFLFVQLYRRLPFRPHRDPASVADVWPQPSPFDNIASSPSSPLQMNKAGVRHKSSWGGAEEELHQLQFVQKHLPGMLEALAIDSEDGKVISPAQFDKLNLLLRSATFDDAPLCHSTPFFANSDPAMPAAPVPAARVLQFLKEHICTASHKEEAPGGNAPQGGDVGMTDAPSSPSSSSSSLSNGGPWQRDWQPQGVTCVDGVTKMSVLKGESNIENGVIRVSHCHDAVVYVLAPLRYASIFGCTDCIVVLGATGKAVKVEHCERVQLLAPCARIRIANCRECVFYLGTNQNPLVLGDNHKIQVAPYNTFYPRLDAHLSEVGVDPSVNLWNVPITLGKTDPHDPNLPTAGAADGELETASLLPPERFVPFVVPFRTPSTPSVSSEQQQAVTRANPFVLPKAYLQALQQKTKTVETLRQTLKTAVLEENKKKELTNVIQAHFKEWLLASGNIRQVYDLARLDRDP